MDWHYPSGHDPDVKHHKDAIDNTASAVDVGKKKNRKAIENTASAVDGDKKRNKDAIKNTASSSDPDVKHHKDAIDNTATMGCSVVEVFLIILYASPEKNADVIPILKSSMLI